MPKEKTITQNNEIETDDLMLQKLQDIENLLSIRVEQSHKQDSDNKDDTELANQLLSKVVTSIEIIKSKIIEKTDTAQKVEIANNDGNAGNAIWQLLKGKDGVNGKDGKDCDPIDVASILKDSEDFLMLVKGDRGEKGDQGESIKGDRGDDGKTPEKGKDYMTDSEMRELKGEVVKLVEDGLPVKLKHAVREFSDSEFFTKKVQNLINDKKTTVKDVLGLSEAIKTEIETVYENVREFSRRSGGGNPQLAKMEDIDWSTAGDGLALKYNAEKKKFVFGTAGGGDVTSVNGQTGVVVLTTSEISEGSNQYFTNARAIGALTGQNISIFTNNAGYITSVAGGDHGTLSGLGDDDHTQYALLAGRSGGQTIKGGTGVTDVLTLVGTSGNGTLASPAVQVNVGNNGATTALTVLNNGNVGIGTTNPDSKLVITPGSAIPALKMLMGGNDPANGAFTMEGLFLSSSSGNGKAFSITANGEGYARGIFYSDGSYGIGGGTASRDVYIKRYSANNLMIDSDKAGGSANLLVTGNVGIGTTSPTGKLDVNGDTIRLRTAKTPATSGASGNQGEIAWDANYVYVCTATNTWKRSAIATW